MKIAVALIERGEKVLRPMSENERYDLALDRAGTLFRIQCKTGRYRRGAVIFNACSSLAHRGGSRKSYAGQVEAFGVYCPQLRTVYLVPIDRTAGRFEQSLRIDAPKNKQSKAVKWASEFELRSEPTPDGL